MIPQKEKQKMSPSIKKWGLFFLSLSLLCVSLKAAELSLEKTDVYPRIFSPNGDTVNDVVYFKVNNPQVSSITGKIYDVSGSEVADLTPTEAAIPLTWDGRDKSGNTVPAGVYLYQIRGEGKTLNGAVAVAK